MSKQNVKEFLSFLESITTPANKAQLESVKKAARREMLEATAEQNELEAGKIQGGKKKFGQQDPGFDAMHKKLADHLAGEALKFMKENGWK